MWGDLFTHKTRGCNFNEGKTAINLTHQQPPVLAGEPEQRKIAEKCGFNSISTFRRVFHRVKGCSFAEYKKNITGE